jgi:hypothetical protein
MFLPKRRNKINKVICLYYYNVTNRLLENKKMIGRTLDALLSPFQMLGAQFRNDKGEDLLLLYLANAMRNFILPVRKCKYWYVGDKDNGKFVLAKAEWMNWSTYDYTDWEIKRQCAEAFEKRRNAKVGETFKLKGKYGPLDVEMDSDVERISDNVVAYREYLISSNEADLIEHESEEYHPLQYLHAEKYTPVLYRGVIW